MNFARCISTKGFLIVNKVNQSIIKTSFVKAGARCLSSKFTQVCVLTKNVQKYDNVKFNKYIHLNVNGALQKKRNLRKKRGDEKELLNAEGVLNVMAYSTAEEYDLEGLFEGLKAQDLYTAKEFFSTNELELEQDVLYVTAKYLVNKEPREIFFFREGSVVMWNFNEIEANFILAFLKPFETEPYLKLFVKGESENMPYSYVAEDDESARFENGQFYLSKGDESFLEKYTFSNSLATSIKLGIWESFLDQYINKMEYLTEDLKKGRKIRISRAKLLQKTGELFALRHMINLSSDLLDTPDFYWDREELEQLYLQVCNYFSISRRTRVMNEKLNHCVELAELVASNLNDAHHIRLEWMIIILIMVEVGFEILHYIDRYYTDEEQLPLVAPFNPVVDGNRILQVN